MFAQLRVQAPHAKLATLVTFLVIVDGKIAEVEAFAFGSG